MGFWLTNDKGHSLLPDGDMMWGDGPADTLDEALTQIIADFSSQTGRPPTAGEVRAGLEFALRGASAGTVLDAAGNWRNQCAHNRPVPGSCPA